eukprot:COSAG05_NODE_5621_length_1128_cov_1.950437_2_plen_77_part_01
MAALASIYPIAWYKYRSTGTIVLVLPHSSAAAVQCACVYCAAQSIAAHRSVRCSVVLSAAERSTNTLRGYGSKRVID